MKHIFIVNPVSGKRKIQGRLIGELKERGLDWYVTNNRGDGEKYIKALCGAGRKEPMRFYACGGDGTLNEVVNGIYGFDNVEAACVPAGSGNDFIRNFGIPAGDFLDIDKQLSGRAVPVDLIRYRELSDYSAARYAINMFNIGFDCNVVEKMAAVKKYPFIEGSTAYFLSILIMLIKKEGADITVEFEDGTGHKGFVLLTAVGNGAFCGGGLKGVPHAEVNDGLLDVCIVKNVSRRVFISLFDEYKKGAHMEDKRAKDIIIYRKCRSVTVSGAKNRWNLCVDGEINTAGSVKFEIVPGAIRFSLPSP